MSALLVRGLAASALLAGCSSGATPAPSASPSQVPTEPPTASPVPSASVTASPTATPLPAGAVAFTVAPDRSTATIRVREQVAGIPAPGEAVLTTSAFSGSLVLLPDGTFAPGSTFAVELDSLKSDSALRDEWIKINTLETRRFPRAEVTLLRVTGVPLPLPASGEWPAKVEATMRAHGVDRDITWDLVITRSAGQVRAAGETVFRFGDHGMKVPANRLILSVVDEIRLAIDVVAMEDGRGP